MAATAANTANREGVLRLCATTLDVARKRQEALQIQARAQSEEAAKQYSQRRDGNHAFWLQIAQVILATVLLPIRSTLLTNLFVTRNRG